MSRSFTSICTVTEVIARTLESYQIDTRRMFEDLDLPPEPYRNPDGRISKEAMEQIWLEAERLTGNPCIGCMEPDFWDEFAGFYEKLPDVPIPGFVGAKTSADYIGSTLVTATVAGVGIHAIASAASGRMSGKSETEEGSED